MRIDWEERRVTVWDCGALGTVVVGGKRKEEELRKGSRKEGEGVRNKREKGKKESREERGGERSKLTGGSCADMLAICLPAASATPGQAFCHLQR